MITVDGILVSAHNLKCDESSATGESDLIRKQAYSELSDCKDPFVLSGSKVSEGIGKFVVCAVGANSFYGKTMLGTFDGLLFPVC
jgi:Ca2+-transporting ATPase